MALWDTLANDQSPDTVLRADAMYITAAAYLLR
jgi:hypothetical protein